MLGSRLIEGALYGISWSDPTTLLEVGLILVAAAVLASAVPAWRAMQVNPAETLRQG